MQKSTKLTILGLLIAVWAARKGIKKVEQIADEDLAAMGAGVPKSDLYKGKTLWKRLIK